MPAEFDVIIVGSGPAGVSAAFPLVEAGLKILMVDGGRKSNALLPSQPFLKERFENEHQWKWIIGEDFYALKNLNAISPKLRVPAYRYVFEDFINQHQIETHHFVAAGSLAQGGLSNAWGAGVARFSASELAEFPFHASDIESSYEFVTRRIGVSGANDDDLCDYFGLDPWAQPPVQMDRFHQQMFARYTKHKSRFMPLDFRLGRTRIAVLSKNHNERNSCDSLGNCLWGCARKAIYSSAYDLPFLLKHKNFILRSGFIVDQVIKNSDSISIAGQENGVFQTISAKKVILAAGALASTRFALHALKFDLPLKLQSCPTAAFLLWFPKMLGAPRTDGLYGQLSFSLKISDSINGFGSTGMTTGVPVSEFLSYLPFRKRYGIDVIRYLFSSCLVGNLFLPGHLSENTISLNAQGKLVIVGGYNKKVPTLMANAQKQLRKAYLHLGALLLPMSFTLARPGTDLHYGCTFPMRTHPHVGETNALGEVTGLTGVHIVDGACLSTLLEKPHTLTIMANADRISRGILRSFV